MNQLVCVKQVPESAEANAAWILNPADACALETALAEKNRGGGTVTVLTMGRPSAEGMLRELLARGADRAVLLTDPAFAGSDTLATARVLAAAVRKLGSFERILTGYRAVDGDTAQTPARLAALLDLPIVSGVIRTEDSETFLCGSGEDAARVHISANAVITFHEGSTVLRLPGILGMRRANRMEITKWGRTDLGLEAKDCGIPGSPTRILEVRNIPEPVRHTRWLNSGKEIAEILQKEPEISERKPALSTDSAGRRTRGKIWVMAEKADESARALVQAARERTDGETVLLLVGKTTPGQAVKRIREGKPECILCVSNAFMRTFAPMVASELETGLTADCTALSITENGLLEMIRPTWGGARMAHIICPEARPQMAMIRSGVYPAAADDRTVPVIEPEAEKWMPECRREAAGPDRSALSLEKAEIIIAGGAGIGSREAFGELEALAEQLGGAAAATRAAVDAGFAVYERQVGQTGQTVRPKIYLAFAVSGAIQHILGMQNAGCISAVNTDPKAPIFRYSDYGLVGDWKKTLDEIRRNLK